MVLGACMGSNYQLLNQIPDDFLQFLNYAIPSQIGGSSEWGNLSHSAVQMQQQDPQCVPGNTSISTQNNIANSRASVEESPLITFANSSFYGDSYLPSNGDTSTESLPTNYGRISCPLMTDHFPAQQQIFQEGQTYPRWSGRQGDQLPNSTFTPQMMDPLHQASVASMDYKRRRSEMQQDNTLHAYSLQQPSFSQVPVQLSSHNPLAADRLFQGFIMRNQLQNQTPLFVPSPHRHQLQCQPLPQSAAYTRETSAALSSMSGSLCYRRLLYYMYHQNNRSADNDIQYWKNFVELYYSPRARKRWCLSKYDNVGNHALGVCTQAIADSWQCEFCGSKLEKGFEASYEYLPWLYQKNFEGGVIEELLCVEAPIEKKLPSGSTVLWFGKAVQESVYMNSRVVHEGQLRIVFTPQLKIISWEFCIQRHEDLISRRVIATQVSDLVAYAKRCHDRNTEGVQAKDQLSMIVTAGNNIVQSVSPSAADDLGFSIPFARVMQVSDTLSCMKDLMADCQTNNLSPVEALKRYSQQEPASAQLRQMQGMSSADGNYQVANTVFQIPDAREQPMPMPMPAPTAKPMPAPTHTHMPMPMPMSMSDLSNYNLQQQAMSEIPLGPSSSMQLPPIDRQIRDLLAYMCVEGSPNPTEKCCIKTTSAGGKGSIVYDAVVDDPKCAEYMNNAKAKLLKYSSGSNSSAKILADSDDDSTLFARYQVMHG